MKPKSWGVFSILVLLVLALTPAASAADGFFAVAASLNGDANYMIGNGDGTFTPQQILQLTGASSISLSYKYSYGNGLGDFDNDGDLDYIAGMGCFSGYIYLSENLGFFADQAVPGYQFAKPIGVAAWSSGSYSFPMDLAVADFNEDGNADFIMSVAGSTATTLYLGSECVKDENDVTESIASTSARLFWKTAKPCIPPVPMPPISITTAMPTLSWRRPIRKGFFPIAKSVRFMSF